MKRALYITLSLIVQWLLAVTFIFSGFVKAADPMGMEYKIEAYVQVLGEYLPNIAQNCTAGSLYLHLAVIILSAFEFILGVCFLFGAHQKMSGVLGTMFMTVMTAVTVYIYIYDPVPDCGCFGDAIILTQGQTLGKNVVLLLCVLALAFRRLTMIRFVTRGGEWVTTNSSFIYIVALSIYTLWYLPLIDFTGYRIGTSIEEALMGEFETVYEYAADGKTIISAESKQIKAPTISEFSMLQGDSIDLADEILTDSSYTYILTLPRMLHADKGCSDQLNDVYDFAVDNHLRMFCATTLSPEERDEWCDITGAAYPFADGSTEMLEAMVRSNPGLLLIHNGRIIGKWGHHKMPNENELTMKALENLDTNSTATSTDRNYLLLSFIYILIMALTVVITNLIRGWRLHKAIRWKQKRQTIFINPIKHKEQ